MLLLDKTTPCKDRCFESYECSVYVLIRIDEAISAVMTNLHIERRPIIVLNQTGHFARLLMENNGFLTPFAVNACEEYQRL